MCIVSSLVRFLLCYRAHCSNGVAVMSIAHIVIQSVSVGIP